MGGDESFDPFLTVDVYLQRRERGKDGNRREVRKGTSDKGGRSRRQEPRDFPAMRGGWRRKERVMEGTS